MIVRDFNKKLKLFVDILRPSWMSLAICLFIALLTVVFYYLFKSVKAVDSTQNTYIINYVQVDFNNFLKKLSSYSVVNNLVPVLFWAIVGILVYIFVRLMVGDVDELWYDISKRKKFLWPSGAKPHIIIDFFERVLLRFVVFIALIIYLVHFVSPFFLGRVLVPQIFGTSMQNWLISYPIISAFVFILLETIALYGVVVLLRLLLLRRRLLSNRG